MWDHTLGTTALAEKDHIIVVRRPANARMTPSKPVVNEKRKSATLTPTDERGAQLKLGALDSVSKSDLTRILAHELERWGRVKPLALS